MTFLPIVERELRVASRRRSTYLGRLGGALIAIALGSWLMLVMRHQPANQTGQALFRALSAMLFLYSLTAGARITADCLSEEKREGTLGLLFLTDLKGYDIVAGKLAANSLNTFYGLLAAFPVLAISLLLGGVSSGEFWRVALVATNLLFFSLAVGMFASAVCRDERRSLALAFFILLLVLGAMPAVELGLNIVDHNRTTSMALLIPSPVFACFGAFGSRLNGFRNFWISVSLTHAYAWTFLLLASSIVPRAWQDKSTSTPIAFRGFWRTIFKTNPAKEIARRTKLLEINPFLWLTGRDPMKMVLPWIVLLSLTSLWLWAVVKWPNDWLSIPSYIFVALTFHTVLKFWLASEACYRFVEDRKNGAMELVLSTPLSVREILSGQRMALFRQFAGPVLYVLAADVILFLLGFNDPDLSRSEEQAFWTMLWFFGVAILLMDLFALSWVSMWVGLKSKRANRAANAAITRILVVPWVVFFLLMTFLAMGSVFLTSHWDGEVILTLWFVIAVINDLVFMTAAKDNLQRRLRELATQRFETSKGWFNVANTNQTSSSNLPPVIHQT